MRIRRASPLLLLLAPCLVSASANRFALHKRELDTVPSAVAATVEDPDAAQAAAATVIAKSQQTTRPYKGTEDAPVDGLDGKPHAGPFVDTSPEEGARTRKAATVSASEKSKPTSLDRFVDSGSTPDGWKLEDIPEKVDGVMNDENRVAPKKGTDGTAGGISEKEKERKAKGSTAENIPQEPKAAPPLPHSEEERIEREQGRVSVKNNPASGAAGAGAGAAAGKEGAEQQGYGSGGVGLEKPNDLPDSPHSTAKAALGTEKDDGPPVEGSGGRLSWLTETMPYTEGVKKKLASKLPSTTSDSTTDPLLPSSDSEEGWHEWFHSFVLSLTMILFSEIGDKTFLIAALMAMRHPRILVFSAAFGALILMTILSAVLGHALPTLLPKRFTTFAAAILFLVFGAKMLREGLAMPKDLGVGEEMREVEAELEEKEQSLALDRSRRRSESVSAYTLEAGRGRLKGEYKPDIPSPPSSRSPSPSTRGGKGKGDRVSGLMNLLSLVLSPAWVQTFVMTFLGEWGDRSQIATIAMAAGQDYWWVTLGAVTGHAFCTGVAVIGGRALAGRVSMRVVTIGGAVAFLVFGVIYLFESLTDA